MTSRLRKLCHYLSVVCVICLLGVAFLTFAQFGYTVSVPTQAARPVGLPSSSEAGDQASKSTERKEEPHKVNLDQTEHDRLRESGELPQATTLEELVSAAKRLDGKMVKFEGEAIGDVFKAGGKYRWLMVEDKGAALSVLVTQDQLNIVKNFGKYGVRGSRLKVTGVYHIADHDQAGELDVRAFELELIDEGGAVELPLHWWKLVAACFFSALALSLALWYRYLRRRSL